MNTEIKFLPKKNLPIQLQEIYKPPEGLYFQGNLEVLNKPLLSIIGTRKNSEYGEYVTKKILDELSGFEITIVSGLAKGIDTLAHHYALSNNLPTVAILGSGLHNIYPPENLRLSQEIIAANGLLLSEYPPEATPLKYYFPQRNRLISGLALATVVIEAPEKSGSLITAKLALEQGKDVFVVPGDIDRENSLGNLQLLQNGGAYPIFSGREIIQTLNLYANGSATEKVAIKNAGESDPILKNLSQTRGIYLDDLKNLSQLPTSELLSKLSILEINGHIKIKHGKYLLS